MKIYHWKKFLKFEYSFFDVIDYFRGNYRYAIYYSKHFKWLMRPHIKEQIDYRIVVMDSECYNNGSCKICGCATTNLQMANKACEGDCYLPLLDRKNWRFFYALFRMGIITHGLEPKEANKRAMKLYVERNND